MNDRPRERRRVPTVKPPVDPAGAEQLRQLIVHLHAVVDLADAVRGRRIRGLSVVVGLNLADVATTSWFLTLGALEGNPLVRPLVHHWWALLAVKAAIVILLARRVLGAPPRSPETAWLMNLAIAYYSLVVGWNLVVITGII